MSGNYSSTIKKAETDYVSAINAQSNYSTPAAPKQEDYKELVDRGSYVREKLPGLNKLKKRWADVWHPNLVSEVNEAKYQEACTAATKKDTDEKNRLALQVSSTEGSLNSAYSIASVNERSEIFLTHFNKDNTLLNKLSGYSLDYNQIAAYAVMNYKVDLYNYVVGKGVNFDAITIGTQSVVGYAVIASSPLLGKILKATSNYSHTIEKAIKSQNKNILEALYDYDKTIFATKVGGLNMLEIALSQGLEQMVTYLLTKDASLINGDSVFILALKTGNYNIIDQVRRVINLDNELIKLASRELNEEVKGLLLKTLSLKTEPVGVPLILKLAETGKLDVLNYLFKHMTNAEDLYHQALGLAYAKEMKGVFSVLQQLPVGLEEVPLLPRVAEGDIPPLLGSVLEPVVKKLVG